MGLINPFGELSLEKTIQKMAQYLQQIASNIGRMYPDTSGRMRVSIDAGTLPTVTTVNTVTTVTTVTTLNNQTQQSGFQTSYDQYAQIQMCASAIRGQIKVS